MTLDNTQIKILIVDDTPVNLEIVGRILSRENYDLYIQDNGFEAVKLAKNVCFDLILLDIMMPGMDGFAVFKEIKSLPEYQDVPIIFLSAKVDLESVVRGFEIGAVDYIKKPFNHLELLARVGNQVELKKSREDLENAHKSLGNMYEKIVAYDSLLEKQVELRTSEYKKTMIQLLEHQEVINTVDNVICVLDDNYGFLNVFAAQEIFFRKSKQLLIGRNLRDILPPDILGVWLSMLAKAKDSGIKTVASYKSVEGGSNNWYRAEAYYKEIHFQKRYIISISDITVENHLNSQNAQFELALRGSNSGIWDWDVAAQTMYLSPKFKEQLGFGDAELPNEFTTFTNLIYPVDQEWVIQKAEQYIQGELFLFDAEFRMLHKDGSYRWMWSRAEALRDPDGKAYRIAGFNTDVTERKEAEIRLTEANIRMNQLAEQSRTITWEVDLNGLYTYISPVVQSILGYTPEELIGRLHFYDLRPAEGREAIKTGVFQVFARKEAFVNFPNRITAKDGRVMWFSTNGLPIIDAEGALRGFRGSSMDITQKKQYEDELKKANQELAHSRDLMRYVIEHARNGVAVHDNEMNYMFVSQPYLESYQVKSTDIIGKHHYEVFPDLPQRWRDVHQRALKGEILSEEEDPYVREDGSIDWTRWECRPWHEQDGKIGGIVLYTEMITERKRIEQELRESHGKYRMLAENASDLVWVFNLDKMRFTYVSPSIYEFTGYTEAEALEVKLEDIFTPDYLKFMQDRIASGIEDFRREPEKIRHQTYEIQQLRKNREQMWIENSVKYQYNPQCEIEVIGSSRNIDERKRAESEVRYLSYHDQLTGLYNRRYFDDRVMEEMERADRYQRPVSMIILDLDHFKKINDTWGHPVGDDVLKQVAVLGSQLIRRCDLIARMGGEEFILLMPETSQEGAFAAAEKFRKALAEVNHPVVGQVTASFGVAERLMSESFISWYKRLDEALYSSKRSGRNRVTNATTLHDLWMMPEIEWKTDWESGNKEIDEQHQEILQLANQLIYMAYSEVRYEKAWDGLEKLISLIIKHFEFEELVLEEKGYPEYGKHSVIHQDLVQRLVTYRDAYKANAIKSSAYLSFIYNDIVLGHLFNEDMAFFPHIAAAPAPKGLREASGSQ